MFLFYLINIIHGESDFISSIRKQLSMNQNDAAFQAANSKILEKNTNDVDNTLFFLRGMASVKMYNFDQGISDLSRFLSDVNNVSPKDKTDAYSLRATAYLKTGQLDEAQKDAQQINDNMIIQEIKKARTWLTYLNSKKDKPIFTLKCYVKLIEICPYSLKFIENLTILALKKDNISYSTNIMTKGKSTLPEDSRIMIKILYSFLTVDRSYISELNTSTKSSICRHLQQQIKDYRSNLIKALDCLRSKDYICASNHVENCNQILTKLPSKNTTQFKVFTQIKIFFENISNTDYMNFLYDREIEYLEELIESNPYSFTISSYKMNEKISDDNFINIVATGQVNQLVLLYGELKDIKKQKDSYSKKDYNKKVNDIKNDIQKGEEKMELYLDHDFDPLYSLFGLKKKADLSDLKKAYKNISKNHNINEKEMEQIDIAYEFLNACKKKWDDSDYIQFVGEKKINLTRTKKLLSSIISFRVGKKKFSYSLGYDLLSEKCYMSYYSDRDDSL